MNEKSQTYNLMLFFKKYEFFRFLNHGIRSYYVLYFHFFQKTFIECLLYARKCVEDDTVEDKLSSFKGFIRDFYVLQSSFPLSVNFRIYFE